MTFSVSDPVFSSSGNYVEVNIPEETSVLMSDGKPMTPVITKVFAFEKGTEITDVQVTYDVKEYTLSGKIRPAPEPVPLMDTYTSKDSKRLTVDETYASSNPLC